MEGAEENFDTAGQTLKQVGSLTLSPVTGGRDRTRQQEAGETAMQTRTDMIQDGALLAAGGLAAKAGKKGLRRLAAAAAVDTAKAASTYSRALRDGTAKAMRKARVDMADPAAVKKWVKDNPGLAREISDRALNTVIADVLSAKTGDAAGKLVNNPVGAKVLGTFTEQQAKRLLESKSDQGNGKSR